MNISCRYPYSSVNYVFVSCSGPVTSVREEKTIFLLSFTCNNVVAVRREFFFPLVLRIGCIIYFGTPRAFYIMIKCVLKTH